MKSQIGDGGRAETGYGNSAGSPIDALVVVGRRWCRMPRFHKLAAAAVSPRASFQGIGVGVSDDRRTTQPLLWLVDFARPQYGVEAAGIRLQTKPQVVKSLSFGATGMG